MSIIKCPEGHFYNDIDYKECPQCKAEKSKKKHVSLFRRSRKNKAVRCDKGHLYDGTKFSECPYCAQEAAAAKPPIPVEEDDDHTIPLYSATAAAAQNQNNANADDEDEYTVPLYSATAVAAQNQNNANADDEDEYTVPLYSATAAAAQNQSNANDDDEDEYTVPLYSATAAAAQNQNNANADDEDEYTVPLYSATAAAAQNQSNANDDDEDEYTVPLYSATAAAAQNQSNANDDDEDEYTVPLYSATAAAAQPVQNKPLNPPPVAPKTAAPAAQVMTPPPAAAQNKPSKVVKCPAGHFYDSNKFPECPHCKAASGASADHKTERDIENSGQTIGFKTVTQNEAIKRVSETAAAQPVQPKQTAAAAPVKTPARPMAQDDVETVAVAQELGIGKAVTGWLVCTQGKHKGRDFTLRSGRNIISEYPGLSTFDPRIAVVYDYMNKKFMLHVGDAPAKLNGQDIKGTSDLAKRDKLEACGLEFVFIPFCEDGFEW